jgi:hypothetical protein
LSSATGCPHSRGAHHRIRGCSSGHVPTPMNAAMEDPGVHESSEARRPWSGRGRALALAIVLTLMLSSSRCGVLDRDRSREVAAGRWPSIRSTRASALRRLSALRRRSRPISPRTTASTGRIRAAIRVAVAEAAETPTTSARPFPETETQGWSTRRPRPRSNASRGRRTERSPRRRAVGRSGHGPRPRQLAPSFAVVRDRLVVP